MRDMWNFVFQVSWFKECGLLYAVFLVLYKCRQVVFTNIAMVHCIEAKSKLKLFAEKLVHQSLPKFITLGSL